jgi:hypothetical protein
MNIRHKKHYVDHGNRSRNKDAPYVLNTNNKKRFCNFLKGVKFPEGYEANLAKSMSADVTKVVGKLKTHTCHVLLQRIIPVGLRGLVNKDLYEAISELGNFFRQLCSRTLKEEVMEKLKKGHPTYLMEA